MLIRKKWELSVLWLFIIWWKICGAFFRNENLQPFRYFWNCNINIFWFFRVILLRELLLYKIVSWFVEEMADWISIWCCSCMLAFFVLLLLLLSKFVLDTRLDYIYDCDFRFHLTWCVCVTEWRLLSIYCDVQIHKSFGKCEYYWVTKWLWNEWINNLDLFVQG